MPGLRTVLNNISHDIFLQYYEYALGSKYARVLYLLGLHTVLNKILHNRYLIRFWNWKCNSIANNFKKWFISGKKPTCSNLQIPKIKYGYQIKKKIWLQKSNFISLYYEHWHIRSPDKFIIRGIVRILEYSQSRQYLDRCQRLSKTVPEYNYFCRTLLLRIL